MLIDRLTISEKIEELVEGIVSEWGIRLLFIWKGVYLEKLFIKD